MICFINIIITYYLFNTYSKKKKKDIIIKLKNCIFEIVYL